MIGDLTDMRQRLRLTLPARWFADSAPVLDALLTGLSASWSSLFTFLQFVKSQTRIGTATGEFLDLATLDLFGDTLSRRQGESDDVFRAKLCRAMRRERATRTALTDAAAEVGFTIRVFEPAQPGDTGAYGVQTNLAWGYAGGWGSLSMPFECLVIASPATDADDDALMSTIAAAMPAGGVAWVRKTA